VRRATLLLSNECIPVAGGLQGLERVLKRSVRYWGPAGLGRVGWVRWGMVQVTLVCLGWEEKWLRLVIWSAAIPWPSIGLDAGSGWRATGVPARAEALWLEENISTRFIITWRCKFIDAKSFTFNENCYEMEVTAGPFRGRNCPQEAGKRSLGRSATDSSLGFIGILPSTMRLSPAFSRALPAFR
jgi:hypothetical protein